MSPRNDHRTDPARVTLRLRDPARRAETPDGHEDDLQVVHRFGDTVVARSSPDLAASGDRLAPFSVGAAPSAAEVDRRPRAEVVASLDLEALRWRLGPGSEAVREPERAKPSAMGIIAEESSGGDLP